jgi:hypothetical protein
MKDIKNLKEVTIKSLKPGKIQQNTFMKVKSIAKCTRIVAVGILVEDNNKDCIFLSLYNQVPNNSS